MKNTSYIQKETSIFNKPLRYNQSVTLTFQEWYKENNLEHVKQKNKAKILGESDFLSLCCIYSIYIVYFTDCNLGN